MKKEKTMKVKAGGREEELDEKKRGDGGSLETQKQMHEPLVQALCVCLIHINLAYVKQQSETANSVNRTNFWQRKIIYRESLPLNN